MSDKQMKRVQFLLEAADVALDEMYDCEFEDAAVQSSFSYAYAQLLAAYEEAKREFGAPSTESLPVFPAQRQVRAA